MGNTSSAIKFLVVSYINSLTRHLDMMNQSSVRVGPIERISIQTVKNQELIVNIIRLNGELANPEGRKSQLMFKIK